MNKFLLYCILFISLMIFGCASVQSSNPVATLIPGNALACVQIGNLDLFLDNTDQFLAATGLSQYLNGINSKTLMSTLLSVGIQGMSLDWFDIEKGVTFALLPAMEGVETWNYFVCAIPLNKKGNENFEKLSLMIKEKLNWDCKSINNYAVFYSQPSIESRIPAKKGMDLKQFDKYDKGGLSIYVNLERIVKATGKTWEDFEQALTKELTTSEASSSLNAQSSVALMGFYFDYLKEMQEISGNLVLNNAGLASYEDVTFVKNGKIHKISNMQKSNINTEAFLKYVPKDALFSCVSKLDFVPLQEMYKDLYAAMGLDDPQRSLSTLIWIMRFFRKFRN